MVDPLEARRLLDADENDRLLALVSPEEVGLAWCRYASRTQGVERRVGWEDDPDGWAAELMFTSEFLADDDFVRPFLLTITDSAPAELLSWVGAGPVAECVGDDPDRLAWAEAQASRSERFRFALSHARPYLGP